MKGSIDLNGFNKDNAPFALFVRAGGALSSHSSETPLIEAQRARYQHADATVLPGQCPRDDTILSRVSIHRFGHRPVTANKCDA